MKQVVFVGTGNIAEAHVEALAQLSSATLAAVVDSNLAAAEAFAKKHNVPMVFESVEKAIVKGGFDVAHVLTPPATHRAIAEPLLNAGIHVFTEKPMSASAADCEALQKAAAASGASLRTNQNYIFHPAHLKMKETVAANSIGPVRSASCRYVMPLRQLAARQFGHWMFDTPLNLLLEQVVHPLSLLDDVMGSLKLETVWAAPAKDFSEGVSLTTEWIANFTSAKGPAQLHVSLGASHNDWSLNVMGEDGQVDVDYLANTSVTKRPGAYLEVSENLLSGLKESAKLASQSVAGAAKYMGAQTKLLGRNDTFYLGIRDSVKDFYQALHSNNGAELDGGLGGRLVTLCEEMVSLAKLKSAKSAKALRTVKPADADAIILGGTGFIGAALTKQLSEEGKKITVVARSAANLSSVFHHENVTVLRGSIADKTFLNTLLKTSPVVINLAHGGGSGTYEQIHKALVGGAETVAEAALACDVKKLLFVSSIAALYLGDAQETIRHDTPVDPDRAERGDYARAKAEAELAMLRMNKEQGLPVSIFRPGIVVGDGGPPFHSGVGLYNRDRVCLGWNNGTNALPFVLVEDVADALAKAAFDVAPEALSGAAFNLVGDVRLTARDYTKELAVALGRPLEFRKQNIWAQQGSEIFKWGIKKIGRKSPAFPSVRDLKSRGMPAAFNIFHEKELLGWVPVADRQAFIDSAIKVHAD